MKTPTFLEGIVIALISSFVGSIGYLALSTIVSDGIVIRLLISSFTGVYLLYLLSRSKDRIGRVSVLALWSILTLFLWLFWPSFTLFIVVNLIAIWLVRSLYFYTSLFSSFADLALNVFSIAIAFWAAINTDSLFLTIWCFFLCQALFVFIPHSLKPKKNTVSPAINDAAKFNRAYQTAEAAVRKLSTYQ